MSGFKFNLKGSKVSKPGSVKPKSSLLAKVAPAKGKAALVRKNILSNDEEDDGLKKTTIDGFDSTKGALNGTTAVSEKKEIIITPSNLSTKLLRAPRTDDSDITLPKDTDNTDDKARISLLRGESVCQTSGFTISMGENQDAEESTEKDYESIPVEQFGMALLRGMGWNGKEKQSAASSEVVHRQRGVTLGIGAKAVEKEIEQELMGSRGAKLTVPMLQKGRK